MVIFLQKNDGFAQVINSLKSEIENHQAVYIVESSSELKDYASEILMLSLSDLSSQQIGEIPWNIFSEVIIFFDQSDEDYEFKINLLSTKKALISFYDSSLKTSGQFVLDKIQKNRGDSDKSIDLQKQVASLTLSLESALKAFDIELKRIKKLYKKMVPLRSSNIKGVEFTSKFYTGESSGGEFFDLKEDESKLFFGASSSNSYLLSSCYMTHFMQLKAGENLTTKDLDSFKSSLASEHQVVRDSSHKEIEFSHLLLDLDLKSLELSIANYGDFVLVSDSGVQLNQLKLDFEQHEQEKVQLERGSKYFIFSPGFVKNWSYVNSQTDLFSYLKNNSQKTTAEIIEEFSFLVKKDEVDGFLKWDATLVAIEVGQNVIHSI